MIRAALIPAAVSRHLRPFLLFGGAGVVGFAVDASVLYGLMALGLHPLTARLLSFLAAATVTWSINRELVFPHTSARPQWRQWARFLAASSAGGILNYAVFSLVVLSAPAGLGTPLLGLVLGSMVGWVVNYSLSHKFVFADRDLHGRSEPPPSLRLPQLAAAPVLLTVVLLLATTLYDAASRTGPLYGQAGFALADAIRVGNPQLVRALVERVGSIDAPLPPPDPPLPGISAPTQATPLYWAAALNKQEVAQFLLERGPDFSRKGNALALCAAAAVGSGTTGRLLLASTSVAQLVDADCGMGRGPEALARAHGHGGLAEAIATVSAYIAGRS